MNKKKVNKFRTDTKSLKWRPRKEVYGHAKNSFEPATFEAKSYNWWTYVRKIKGKVVFNDYNYSHTTSRHQREMRDLLRELGIKIDLVIETRSSLSLETFKADALKYLYTKLYQSEIKMNRKGSKPEDNVIRAKRIDKLKADIKLARSLGATFTKEQMQTLKESILKDEANSLAEMHTQREQTKALLARDKVIKDNQTAAVNFRL